MRDSLTLGNAEDLGAGNHEKSAYSPWVGKQAQEAAGRAGRPAAKDRLQKFSSGRKELRVSLTFNAFLGGTGNSRFQLRITRA